MFKKKSKAEAKDELWKVKKIEQEINRNDLIYKAGNKKKIKHDFPKFKKIGRKTYNGVITLNDAF